MSKNTPRHRASSTTEGEKSPEQSKVESFTQSDSTHIFHIAAGAVPEASGIGNRQQHLLKGRSYAMARTHQQERIAGTKFECHAPAAQAVFLAGTFNDWDPNATPMTRVANGNWEIAVVLAPGRYEFKFVVDGEWCCEPGCDVSVHGSSNCVPNSFGSMNRLIEVT